MWDKLWKTSITLTAELLGLVVVPIALLFTDKDSEHLPKWAYPWDNDWDGINGRAESYVWVKRYGTEGVKRFWPRFLWLAIRNRASNVSQLLGKRAPVEDDTYRKIIPIPLTSRCFKITWGYTSYKPGGGSTSLKEMPKHNFTCSISLRDVERTRSNL